MYYTFKGEVTRVAKTIVLLNENEKLAVHAERMPLWPNGTIA